MEKMCTSEIPEEIELKDHLFDLQFSPILPCFAVCDVEGIVREYTLGMEPGKAKEVWRMDYHSMSCRRLCYSKDGKYILTGSSDRSIGVVSGGILHCRVQKAHKAPISALLHIEGSVLASGDDDGAIKVWDLRAGHDSLKPRVEIHPESDMTEGTISDMKLDSTTLLVTSNNGTLSAYDLRKTKSCLQERSNCFEEDLLSMEIVKHGKKIVVGSQEGNLHIFSRELLQVADDRIKGHPLSIDTLAKIDEDTIITGSEDGLVRGISIHPNKILCILYGVSESTAPSSPIWRVAVSCDRQLGAAIHESSISFFNLKYLLAREKAPSEPGKSEAGFFDNLQVPKLPVQFFHKY